MRLQQVRPGNTNSFKKRNSNRQSENGDLIACSRSSYIALRRAQHHQKKSHVASNKLICCFSSIVTYYARQLNELAKMDVSEVQVRFYLNHLR